MQKYFDNVVNRVGDVVPGASVYVTVTATGAAATLYSDDGVTAQSNPTLTDNSGYFFFYAADGVYTLTISGSGIQTLSIPGVLLEDGEFTQSGSGAIVRTWQDKARDLVCVDDFGADPLGVTSSSAAFAAAWAAVKVSGTVKKGIFGNGKYKLSSAVVFGGVDDLDLSTDAGSNVSIDIATITPDSGIGVAITIHGLRRPEINLSFVNGGNEAITDVGVEWYNVEAPVLHIKGSNYRGLLCKYDGTKGTWLEQGDGTIWARKCYKNFQFIGTSSGSHNTGTGHFASIWEVLPTLGSVAQYLDDLTIDHWESTILTPTFTATNAAAISDCSSVHLGTVALGKQAGNLLLVNGCTNVHIKDLYTFGGNASGSGTAAGLLAYDNALFSIGNFTPSGCLNGLICGGNNNLEIDNLQALNNGTDILIEQNSGSSLAVNLAIDRYFSQNAYVDSLRVAAGGISGTLTIGGGRIRTGNVGAAGTAAIYTSLSSTSLFTRCDGLEIDTSWGTSVLTRDETIFAGYGNKFNGATSPITDAGGRKGSLDGRTWLIALPDPTPDFATSYQNTNSYPVAVWIPLRFETTAVAGDYATLQLIDYEGTTHDLVDTQYIPAAPGIVIPFVLQGIVPAGWSWKVTSSSAAVRVTFSGTSQSIRI